MYLDRKILNKLLLLLNNDDSITIEYWDKDTAIGTGHGSEAGLYAWTLTCDATYISMDDDGPISFDDIVWPIMQWLRNNHNPHTKILIDSGCAELLSGEKSFNKADFND